MSNSNKKIKAADIVVKADSEAALDSAKLAKRAKTYKLMLGIGIICAIAYVALIIAFLVEGRGSGKIYTGKMLMMGSAVAGGVGAAMLTGCTIINETKRMFSIGVALIGVFCVGLFFTYLLLLKDYTKGTNTAGVGSTIASITVVSLVAGILLMIIAAIRTKVEQVIARKKSN